jgi:hypothetical protein
VLIGHYAPAFVLQRVRPSVRLWQLFLATQIVDVLWALLVLLGVERVRIVPGFTASNDLDLWYMPFSHGLFATALHAALAYGAWRTVRRGPDAAGDALVVAIAVASHFAGDLPVHVPDLPIWSGAGPKLGFGLWQHRSAALAFETSLFAAAALYWWWPRRAMPGARFAGAAAVLLAVVAVGSFFVPTPPTPVAMAVTGLVTYALTVALAARMER